MMENKQPGVSRSVMTRWTCVSLAACAATAFLWHGPSRLVCVMRNILQRTVLYKVSLLSFVMGKSSPTEICVADQSHVNLIQDNIKKNLSGRVNMFSITKCPCTSNSPLWKTKRYIYDKLDMVKNKLSRNTQSRTKTPIDHQNQN